MLRLLLPSNNNNNNIYSSKWPETRKGNCPSTLAPCSKSKVLFRSDIQAMNTLCSGFQSVTMHLATPCELQLFMQGMYRN